MNVAGVQSGDEVAVKARLLFDGDGTGDDRRLMMLLKQMMKWCSDNGGSVEDDVRMHARLVAQVMQVEWTDAKSKLVQEMTEKEAGNYDNLLGTIQGKITQTEKDILEAKQELESARMIRKNRMEYDAMAKRINEHPSRQVTGKKIDEIRTELDRLKEEEEQLNDKLEQRKKQFHVLVHSIHQLQNLLDQEEEEEAVNLSKNASTIGTELGLEDGPVDELNTSNVSSSPEENQMELS